MFYFFAKRRQDINAAEERGRVEGRQETRAAIHAVAARFDREPNATPAEVIQALRDELTADRVR